MKTKLLAGILLAVLPALYAQELPSNDYYFAGDFYRWQGEFISLARSRTQVVVKFKPLKQDALPNLPLPGEIVKEISLDRARFALLQLPARPAKQEAQAQMAKLRAYPEVEFVAPLLFNPKTQTHLFPTGELVVKLKPGQTLEALLGRFAELKLGVSVQTLRQGA